MATVQNGPKDAYDLILAAIDSGAFRPGDRLVAGLRFLAPVSRPSTVRRRASGGSRRRG